MPFACSLKCRFIETRGKVFDIFRSPKHCTADCWSPGLLLLLPGEGLGRSSIVGGHGPLGLDSMLYSSGSSDTKNPKPKHHQVFGGLC